MGALLDTHICGLPLYLVGFSRGSAIRVEVLWLARDCVSSCVSVFACMRVALMDMEIPSESPWGDQPSWLETMLFEFELAWIRHESPRIEAFLERVEAGKREEL